MDLIWLTPEAVSLMKPRNKLTFCEQQCQFAKINVKPPILTHTQASDVLKDNHVNDIILLHKVKAFNSVVADF